jgi:hypothetical protein
VDLRTMVMDVLQANASRALTFDEGGKGITERLDIRDTLNDLYDAGQIQRHQGGKNHVWRYQAVPIQRRA